MALQRRIMFAAKTLSADCESEAICIERAPMFSIHAILTGSPSGALKLQGSNVLKDDRPQSWADIDATSKAISQAGDVLWNIPCAQFAYVRVVFVKGLVSSGAISAVWNSNGAGDA